MKKPLKRIIALIGAILLAGLAACTLIVAIFFPEAGQLFAVLVGTMIGLPILLWLLIYVLGKVKENML